MTIVGITKCKTMGRGIKEMTKIGEGRIAE